jgi:dihydroflavonol-4-reductase
MNVLVIGASGFIGLNVVDSLLARGLTVRATRRKHTPTLFLRKRAVELVDASLEEYDALVSAMQGCDAVFLCGAHYPRYSLDLPGSIELGVGGVQNACRAARAAGVSCLVYTSSIATLARVADRLAHEGDTLDTMPTGSVYRAVKWAMEREVERHACSALRVVTVLPGGCVGPWDLRLGTSGLLVALVRGQLPYLVEGIASVADVGDVAEAHVRALDAASSRYCIAPHAVPFEQLACHIVQRYGGVMPETVSTARARVLSENAERAASRKRERVAFPRELVDVITAGQPVSCDLARRELGLEFTTLDDTLDRAHAFLVRYGYLPRRRLHEEEIHGQPRH